MTRLPLLLVVLVCAGCKHLTTVQYGTTKVNDLYLGVLPETRWISPHKSEFTFSDGACGWVYKSCRDQKWIGSAAPDITAAFRFFDGQFDTRQQAEAYVSYWCRTEKEKP